MRMPRMPSGETLHDEGGKGVEKLRSVSPRCSPPGTIYPTRTSTLGPPGEHGPSIWEGGFDQGPQLVWSDSPIE